MKKIPLLFLILCSKFVFAGQKINYKANGENFEGYYEKAKGKSRGLVVVIHDWDGLTDYEEQRVQMLAKKNYDAFAIDLYGKDNRPVEMKMKKAETAKLYNDRALMQRRILAGVEEARKKFKKDTVVIGYCFGGAAVLELARSNKAKNIKGYATFHGGLQTPEGQSYSSKTPPLFIAHGGADSSITLQDVANLAGELEEAKVPYEVEIYSAAPHAFTVFGSERYQKAADQKSWTSFLNFLDKNLAK